MSRPVKVIEGPTLNERLGKRDREDVLADLKTYADLTAVAKTRGETRPVPGRIDRLLDELLDLSLPVAAE